ncbi:MAG: cytochrome c [Pseudomonadota bacterium]
MKYLFLAAALAAAAGSASAHFQKPEDAVKYRQSAFAVMGAHFSRLGAMANGRVPFDAAAAQANADLVATMAKLPFTAFGEGTDKAGNSKAKPEVWGQADKFKAAANKMGDEVTKLQAAARTGKLDQIKAQFGATAQSCKACHDDFRKE